MAEKIKVLEIEFSGLSGEKRKMSVLKMGHRDFWETFHSAIQAVSGGLKVGRGKISFNPMQILQSLDFDTFENIARKTLAYGVLDGVGTIKDPFDCEFFSNHPDELYAATYAAFVAQNPEMFPKKKEAEKSADSASQNKAAEAVEAPAAE